MEANIGRIPSEPAVPPTPVRPVGKRREEKRDTGSFDEELEDRDAETGRSTVDDEENGSKGRPPAPPPTDGVGSQLDLTA